ncbi:unnamed protein product [Parnassius mnemosyne]|uniref:Transposase n=1 Tax=Parnassius mnemosyne TaxID=213953 RepID=A0AAV1M2M8_9NEOP
MYLIYGETRQVSTRGIVSLNARLAARLYAERYPDRVHPTYEVIKRLDSAYREGRIPGTRGSQSGRPRTIEDDIVLQEREEEPSTSVRMIQSRTGITKSSVYRILKKRYQFHPYHIQRVQTLLQGDYVKRVLFCRRMLELNRQDPDFFHKVLWTDESQCRRDGYLNLHNIHSWQLENPHETREDRSQYMFKINLWTGIFNGSILGPVELPPALNGENYLAFLQHQLPTLLEDVPLQTRATMWYQNDGCPAHYARDVRAYLDDRFPGRWIGRLGPILWPPRSPDLNPLDFFIGVVSRIKCT